jgi:PAS domain S-box-containing protein
MKLEKTSEKQLQEKIEELTLANQKLKYDSFLLGSLFKESEDAIYFKDRESRFTDVNPAMARKMGAESISAVLGKTDYDYFLKEHADNAFQDEQNLMKGGESVLAKVEKETWPDGTVTWANSSKMPLRDADNKIIGIVGISRDVTDRIVTEQQLQASEERFHSLIKHLSDVILIIDKDDRITYASDSSKEILGVEPNDLIGNFGHEMVHPDDRSLAQDAFITVMQQSNAILPAQVRYKHPNKGWLHIDLIANNLLGQPGIEGIVLTIRDISERKKAEVEQEKILLELERSNRELEQFAYAVSHDLQEPLRKVRSFAELLSERYGESLDEKATTYIEYLVDGAQRMQILIQDLLSYSRIISRGEPFVKIDSSKSLNDALANLEMAIQESNARIEVGKLPEIKADASQLTRLFQNLVSNAIKFQKDNDPVIRISVDQLKNHWKFMVSDNGIGIDPQFSDRIFQVFQRLHSREEYAGTGIGLALCKRIVERHGGEILVDSETGTGTTFIFTISKELQ